MKNFILSIGVIVLFPVLLLSQNIWVMNDGDPDYQNPPFNDSLKVFQSDGVLLLAKGGFNTAELIFGIRHIAASQDGNSCWVGSLVNDSLLKVDIQGNIELRIPRNIDAIDLEENGLLYGLTNCEYTFGDSILVLDQNGNYIMGESYGGIDLAVDNEHSSVWIVGEDIKRLNLDLQHQFTIDPIAWTATSVDYASDGTAWIGEALNSNNPDSKNRLLHIDLNGAILDSIDLIFRPKCLRVDRTDESVWMIGNNDLYKYLPGQSQLNVIDNISGCSLSIDQHDSLIWAATFFDVRSYTKAGELQTVLTNFYGGCFKYISVPEQTSTTIEDMDKHVPGSFSLGHNYPNPFNPRTTIKFTLPTSVFVNLEVYTISGEKVATLVSEYLSSGEYNIDWNAIEFPSGVYIYQLKAGGFSQSKKLILLK